MTKQQQTTANMRLLEKLMSYLAKNPQADISPDENVSYVMFSSKDSELNSLNESLLQTLIKEGERVIKAEETDNKKLPWKFTPISA